MKGGVVDIAVFGGIFVENRKGDGVRIIAGIKIIESGVSSRE